MKKLGGTGGKVRWRVGGDHLPSDTIKSHHHFKKKALIVWSNNLLCILEMSFPSFIS